MIDKKVLYWLGNDLRASDNPALTSALQIQGQVLAAYIFDPNAQGKFCNGNASNWWLKKSLQALNKSFKDGLNFYSGESCKVILDLVKKHKIELVVFNRVYEPWRRLLEKEVQEKLQAIGVEVESFNASLLFQPEIMIKQDGTPYKVFTPFYKNLFASGVKPRKPLVAPVQVDFFKDCQSLSLEDCFLKNLEEMKFLEGFWTPGEVEGLKKLNSFVSKGLANYKKGRDYPSLESTSKLSPHLHFGEISPNIIWYQLLNNSSDVPASFENKEHFLRELCWREFCYYQLYHFPELPEKNFNPKYDAFLWENNQEYFKAWKEGKTGYPMVDAGMRELAQTGVMHNRVRMIVASFLIKNLFIDWRDGARWFWESLVDADLANNSANWQWVAGSGVDAAPFFRIFSPVLQGEKFDAKGEYCKRFLPELANLDLKYFFAPWTAPVNVLRDAGIELGKTYPRPIVDFAQTRKMALAKLRAL